MKPECLALKEKMFGILSVISLFTAKYIFTQPIPQEQNVRQSQFSSTVQLVWI